MNILNLTNLPSDFIVEQSILSILLKNPGLIKNTFSKLKVSTFYSEDTKLIYQVLINLLQENESITLPLVISKLQDEGLIEKIGGVPRINSLIHANDDSFYLEKYIKILNDKYLRRLLIDLGKQIIHWSYNTSEHIDKILEKIDDKLITFEEDNFAKKIYSTAEIVEEIHFELKNKIKKTESVGFETNFKDLDSILQGFQKSDLIIIAGRPSMGKTAFALNVAKNIVSKYQIPLIVFSLEMSRQQILYRFLSNESNINSNRLKSGKMNKNEWENLSRSMQQLAELPIFIDDSPNLTIMEIRSKLKKIINPNNKNALIIIDYLQLMKANLKMENRVQEISDITRNLKILAKEFQIPILLLSQLSRNVESRINKRPMLADLRESGCISQPKVNEKKKLKIWNKNSIISVKNEIQYTFKGIKPTFSLKSNVKNPLILTANHKILSKEGWIRFSEINKKTEFYLYDKIEKQNSNCLMSFRLCDEISYTNLNPVYDCTIPFFHNYFKNNFVIHNSIEQDADIVIMLYREEYYNEKTSQPHITEFIIAKHRNGPVGTAKLLFHPYTTSFTNI
jgi:replicative DNA helicase